jgi:uncharacterized membrane protein YeaQ/YmgE (transglycosylase-associated protein family)
MLDMNVLGWIVVGFFAGWISGALVGARTARGCLPNIFVGILGGLLGGWLATEMGFGPAQGFIAALVVAVFGSLVVRLVLNALSER